MLTHIAGIPVEEAALSLVPVAATVVGSLGLRRRLRSTLRRQSAALGPVPPLDRHPPPARRLGRPKGDRR